MKLNKYIGLAAMPLLFAACQNDALEENIQQEKSIYTLSGTMAGGAAMSRAQVELGNTDGSKESFLWNEGDQIALFQGSGDYPLKYVYTISSDYSETGNGDKKTATFQTDNPAINKKYVAIYPANIEVENGTAKFPLQQEIDFTSATTVEEQNAIWKEYLKNNMYMMAKGTLTGDGNDVVNFEHLCTMFRVSYTNETAETQSIEQIVLWNDQNFRTGYSYYITGEYDNGHGSTNMQRITTAGLTVGAGETTDFYIMFFPSGFGDGNISIELSINKQGHTVSIPISTIAEANTGDTEFKAGKRYWFKLTGYNGGLVWAKDFIPGTVSFNNPSIANILQNLWGEKAVEIDEEGVATISKMSASTLTELNLNGYTVTSLEGIEVFPNLKRITADNVGLEGNLYFGNNPMIEYLDLCNNADITGIDVTKNDSLKSLLLVGSQITSLDLTNNENLEGILVVETPLESLDLSKNLKLNHINCRWNKLTVLDITPFTALNELYCGEQRTEQDIIVTMTTAQKERWDTEWYDDLGNTKVTIEVK